MLKIFNVLKFMKRLLWRERETERECVCISVTVKLIERGHSGEARNPEYLCDLTYTEELVMRELNKAEYGALGGTCFTSAFWL